MSEKTPDSDVMNKINALTKQIEAQNDKIHALEIEKRVSKIHAKNAKFDPKGKSLDFLDGYCQALEDLPANSPKQHSVAEVVPKETAIKQHKVDEPIDEDEIVITDGSGL